MRWKTSVNIVKNNGYELQQGTNTIKIAPEDEYIIEAVEHGIIKDEELVKVIMKHENVNDIVASFRLAQFVVDYGDFIAELNGHMVIEE